MADYLYDYDYDRPFRRPSYRRRGWPRSQHPGYRARRGYGPGWRAYDQEFESRAPYSEIGYGGEYRKTRWETDYGDPFRDRDRGTRIRMMPGDWDEYGRDILRYGEEYWRRRRRPLTGRTRPGARAAGEFYGPPGEYGREFRARRRRYS